VVPTTGDFYVGRDYTLTWTPVADHTTPAANAITTSGTYQGNYIDLGADACAGFAADYTANNGWSTEVDELDPATEELTIDFYARPTAANQNALFVVAENYATTPSFGESAILIRFNTNNLIDVRDGTFYCDQDPQASPCDNAVPYVPGEWYHFVVNANIGTQSYTVQVETCDDGLVTVIADAAFRDTAGTITSLEVHAAYSDITENLDIDQVLWTPGVCVPTLTCGAAPRECGAPLDDCGDPLSCGTCGVGETCFPEGTCCTIEADTTTCGANDCGSKFNNCGQSVDCDAVRGTCDSRVPGEVCNGTTCSEPGGSNLGDPYVHVTQADIGVTIGPGVIAPYPTVNYTGPCTITQNGTTIENRIVNCDTLRVDADNVTIRNSVITVSNLDEGASGIRMGAEDGTVQNFLMEYSHFNYPNPGGKVGNIWGSFPSNDFSNFTLRKNHIEGGFDLFDMAGDLDGMLVEYNVLGPLACKTDYTQHSDCFQIGGGIGGTGNITIRGNYILHESLCGKTAIWWMARGSYNATIESNRLTTWGASTLWASDVDTMQVRYNVYSSDFQAQIGNRCSGAQCDAPQAACCYYPIAAGRWNVTGAPSGSAICNRYEDGSFVEQQWFQCEGGGACPITYDVTGCPAYTP